MATRAELRRRIATLTEDVAEYRAALDLTSDALLECEIALDECRNPPPPPATDLGVPGYDRVISEDLATEPNPSFVWGGMSSPVSYGREADGANDPYFEVRSGGGSPFLACGRDAPTPRYRRHYTKAGEQSVYDKNYGNTSTRTQSQTWSKTGNLMSIPTGQRVAYQLDFRPQGPTTLPNTQHRGGGNSEFTQLQQWKAHGNGTWLTVSYTLGSDAVKLICRRTATDVPQVIAPVENGVWRRIATVIDWRDGGSVEMWLSEGDKMVQVAEVVNLPLTDGRPDAAWGLGPYHALSLFDGSEAGHPANDYYCDYANAQILGV